MDILSPRGRFAASLPHHPKTFALAKKFRLSRAKTVGHLVCLWSGALTAQPDGDFSEWENEWIAELAMFDRKQGAPDWFVEKLQEVGFLDENKRLHNWAEYNPPGRGKPKERKRRDVYVIQAVETPFVKIGSTRNVSVRLRELQTSSPRQLIALTTFVGVGRAFEKGAHERFRKRRVRGEWFELTMHEVAMWADEVARNGVDVRYG